MIKAGVPGSEYFNVPADNISSWCTSRKGTVFTWGADIEQSKVSDIPSRNSKTNNFQNGRAKFEIIIQFNSVQFNLILYYLWAESTATRPITDTAQCNYIMDNYKIKSNTNYRQAQEVNHINAEK
jgi:hypothetical protein